MPDLELPLMAVLRATAFRMAGAGGGVRATRVAGLVDHGDADGSCRRLVAAMGEAGLLAPAVAADGARFDVRTLCLARETLAYHDGLADFAFALQGLGSGPVSLFGTSDAETAPARHRRREGDPRLRPDRAGGRLRRGGDGDDGERGRRRVSGSTGRRPISRTAASPTGMWCSPAPARRPARVASRRSSSTPDAPGLTIAGRIETIAPHPLARIVFDGCRVPTANRIGGPGDGFRIAMATLDVFRSTVGAAALGFARRAFDETVAHVTTRKTLGGTLADLQMTQSALAEMATEIDASALLVYRAAWAKDAGAERVTREAAMAKIAATEAAQRVIDRAVQLHGARGVTAGVKVEALYREIRALRIYEGASEIQKLIIARTGAAGRRAGR